jgi:1-acyl-sn-glycerol-3-phosphate acyltransferase
MQESNSVNASKDRFRVPLFTHIIRVVLRSIFSVIFRLICRVEIVGKKNIPNSAYIIAYNHISLFEPPLILTFWPQIPEAVAGADVFERGAIGRLVQAYHAIPVKRGEYDRKVIDTMMAALAEGHPLAIAPEGGRSHETSLRQARAGVAYMIDRAGVPVVPVGITGTTKNMLRRALKLQRPHLIMKIGKPFTPPSIAGRGEVRRAARQENADLVMREIAKLIPKEYHGFYA